MDGIAHLEKVRYVWIFADLVSDEIGSVYGLDWNVLEIVRPLDRTLISFIAATYIRIIDFIAMTDDPNTFCRVCYGEKCKKKAENSQKHLL
jgi:hypothetical protein